MCTYVYVLYCVPFYCVFCLFLFCLFFVCLFCCCLFFAIVRHISMLFIDNEDSVFCMMHNYYYVSWDLKGHIFILDVNQLLHKYLLGRRGGRGRSVRFQFETSHESFNFLLVEKNRLKLRSYRPLIPSADIKLPRLWESSLPITHNIEWKTIHKAAIKKMSTWHTHKALWLPFLTELLEGISVGRASLLCLQFHHVPISASPTLCLKNQHTREWISARKTLHKYNNEDLSRFR